MVTHSNGRAAALLDSAGPGTSGSASLKVNETDDVLVVRVPLCQGPFELRVPRAAGPESCGQGAAPPAPPPHPWIQR